MPIAMNCDMSRPLPRAIPERAFSIVVHIMQFGPALRAAAGIAVLSIMDAIIKAMAVHYSTFQVTFLRFAFGTLVATAIVAAIRPGLAEPRNHQGQSRAVGGGRPDRRELFLRSRAIAASRDAGPVVPLADVRGAVRAAAVCASGSIAGCWRRSRWVSAERWSSSWGRRDGERCALLDRRRRGAALGGDLRIEHGTAAPAGPAGQVHPHRLVVEYRAGGPGGALRIDGRGSP